MSPNEKKARELARLSINFYEKQLYGEACKKMSKEASPERKKEIEDFRTKVILKAIQKDGLEQVEERAKIGIKMAKIYKQSEKLMKKHRTAKNIKRNTNRNRKSTCKYNKKQASYISKFGV
jgi:hypothetical protein